MKVGSFPHHRAPTAKCSLSKRRDGVFSHPRPPPEFKCNRHRVDANRGWPTMRLRRRDPTVPGGGPGRLEIFNFVADPCGRARAVEQNVCDGRLSGRPAANDAGPKGHKLAVLLVPQANGSSSQRIGRPEGSLRPAPGLPNDLRATNGFSTGRSPDLAQTDVRPIA